MTTLEEPLSRLDGSLCMAIRDDSQHQQALQSVYSALEDVLKLPRLQLIAAEAGIIVPIVERCLHRLVPACAPLVLSIHNAARLLVQYIDWMGALLPKYAPTSHQHADAIALVCAVVTCASPPQLHTVLPDPTLDCMARLIHNATPDHASWLLACAVQAIDTAYTIPPHPSPGTPEILAALVSLDQLRSMVARVSTGGHTMPLLQTAISTAHMPQHAAAAAMALGCLQSLAAGSGVDHNASNAQRFALACMVRCCSSKHRLSYLGFCGGGRTIISRTIISGTIVVLFSPLTPPLHPYHNPPPQPLPEPPPPLPPQPPPPHRLHRALPAPLQALLPPAQACLQSCQSHSPPPCSPVLGTGH